MQFLATMASKHPHGRVSGRNLEILICFASGVLSSSIEQTLNLSTKTVIARRRHILAKLELQNDGDTERYADRRKLLFDESTESYPMRVPEAGEGARRICLTVQIADAASLSGDKSEIANVTLGMCRPTPPHTLTLRLSTASTRW
ncbi:response regulator transcription factor [Burkholderia vietnamiensis]|nr:response regulator transcription factor [Burkholderia vietnamiensis]